MNNKSQHVITSKQLIFTLVSSMVGVGILSLPRVAADGAKQDAGLVVLLAAGLPLINLFIIYGLSKRFPNLTLAEYSQKVFGRFLGGLISLAYVGYNIAFAVAVLQLFSYTLHTIALPRTPIMVLNLVILLVCANFARQDFKVIARLNEILFYFLIPILPILMLSLRDTRIEHLWPIYNVPLTGLWKGIQNSIFAYLGYEIFLVIAPFVEKKEDSLKGISIGLSLTAATYFYVTFICLAYFGPWAIQKFTWPLIAILSTINVPVVQRLEFYFIFLWVGVVFRTIGIQMFSASYTCARTFRLPSHGFLAWLLVPVIAGMTYFTQSLPEAVVFANLISFLGLGVALGIPVILLSAALILGKKEAKGKNA